ncbi:MAG: chromate ion transporter family chromate transporter [Deltaproteobacteria bacterium]|nr:MAG: chromate ion transporter family chromate transporter [Deltaproteobacteria bacterium]
MSTHPATPFRIFAAFLRLGLTAFGGPAMVAYIRRMTVKEKGWVKEDSFKKGVALCQTIPGATAMQAAAYAGLRAGGPWGAVAAYIAFGLPAFVLMVTLSAMYTKTHDLPGVISLFSGLQVIVIALVANATVNFGRRYLKRRQDIFLLVIAAGFLALGGSPIIAIVACAALGLVFYRPLFSDTDPPLSAPRHPNTWQAVRPALMLALSAVCLLALLFFIRRDLFSLSVLMLKIDFFAFGGGYGSIPLLFHEIVEVRHWMDHQALMDGIALGQVTPGPIVITATFAGYLLAKLPGALVGTIFIFTPSLFLLLLVVPYFDRIEHNVYLQRGLRGVLVSFVGLLLAVTIRFAIAVNWTPLSLLITLGAFFALFKKVNILWVVLVGAAASVLLL